MPRSAARATKCASPECRWAITGPEAVCTASPIRASACVVVLVHDDDGQVGVLARDQLGRLLDGDRERRDVVAELARARRRALCSASLVLVRQQDGEVGLAQGADGGCGHGHRHGATTMAGAAA